MEAAKRKGFWEQRLRQPQGRAVTTANERQAFPLDVTSPRLAGPAKSQLIPVTWYLLFASVQFSLLFSYIRIMLTVDNAIKTLLYIHCEKWPCISTEGLWSTLLSLMLYIVYVDLFFFFFQGTPTWFTSTRPQRSQDGVIWEPVQHKFFPYSQFFCHHCTTSTSWSQPRMICVYYRLHCMWRVAISPNCNADDNFLILSDNQLLLKYS